MLRLLDVIALLKPFALLPALIFLLPITSVSIALRAWLPLLPSPFESVQFQLDVPFLHFRLLFVSTQPQPASLPEQQPPITFGLPTRQLQPFLLSLNSQRRFI